MNTTNNAYGASEITVLEGLEAVRKRPGMYIGNTGKEGLHRCFGEILDNSVDEYMAGFAKNIHVNLDPTTSQVIVSDDGRGIPVDIHSKTGKTALETIMTVLHAGGKFDQSNYQFSGGLHGVGASVVNALSDLLQVWVLREKIVYYMTFSKGKVTSELISFNENELLERFPQLKGQIVWKKTGTVTSFLPDTTIFETIQFSVKDLTDTLKQTAYLNKGLKITFDVQGDNQMSDLAQEVLQLDDELLFNTVLSS
jgi:DNA gyrase subunit B